MKLELQYVNDINGNVQAVQLPLAEWKMLLKKLNKYEQALKLKSDLKEAFNQIAVLKQTKKSKQTLKEFLNEL